MAARMPVVACSCCTVSAFKIVRGIARAKAHSRHRLFSIILPTSAALADPPPWAPAHGKRAKDRDAAVYYDRAYEPRRLTRDDRVWRGEDGRYHCRRSDGTTGLIVGAGVGALLGRSLDGGRDRTAGTILGAAGGALLGKAIDQGDLNCH